MVFAVAFVLTVLGLFLSYISAGLARTAERNRGYIECEKRLEILRRQVRRLR